ncbi:MAG: GNAT family N-acetyltransferase [Rhizobium sp. 63-7]|nr:MAG: GNAT family N-acetyltransferase [Rhizobium sp. 63-7]
MFFVRTGGERDLAQVSKMLTETLHATYNTLYSADEVEAMATAIASPAALRAALREKGGEFLVADDGRKIGGMAFAGMSDRLAKTAVIRQLYVHPSHQRQGVGRDLFAEIETCFPDAEILRLEIDSRNAGAIAFFHAHGMREIDRIEVAGDPAPLTVVLEKPLGL